MKIFDLGNYDKWLYLNYDRILQIYFFCVKRQAKNDFLKDVESTVDNNHCCNNR